MLIYLFYYILRVTKDLFFIKKIDGQGNINSKFVLLIEIGTSSLKCSLSRLSLACGRIVFFYELYPVRGYIDSINNSAKITNLYV